MQKRPKNEHLASEAKRLLSDLTLQTAIKDARQEHLENLSKIDPEDYPMMARTQAVVHALDDIGVILGRYVQADEKYESTQM
jgi:hypothetical protein